MKLAEALQTLHESEPAEGKHFSVLLACGFTPLNLEVFLSAHLRKSVPGRRVKVATGVFGDLIGTLERQHLHNVDAVAVALEWPDLDPRLGYRSLGGWGPSEEGELADNVQSALSRIRAAIEQLGMSARVAVSLPTLPMPPVFHTAGWETGKAELDLWAALANFAAGIAACRGVAVANPQRLLESSPHAQRFDLKGEIAAGQPYSVSHADAMGAALAELLRPATPKKGLITDLDDTLWRGIAGEVGPDAVAWDLDNRGQLHGLYQRTLKALAGQGVLLAAASKNNPEVVEQVFSRRDILLSKDNLFPIEVGWKPKSESVGRILAAWNINADSVVFVDDSPMELAEVKSTWPEVDCILFPKNEYEAAPAFLRRLRDSFGKSRLAEEDGFRLASIRAGTAFSNERPAGPGQETFLSALGAVLTVQFNPPPTDSRVIELVNKTNQFNLNGVRFTEAEWWPATRPEHRFEVLISYNDKYGPLGKIAVLAGHREVNALHIQTWVMSCRAFSRRIEHGCMELLFSTFPVEELQLAFAPTQKNGPFRDCFVPYLGAMPGKPFTITRPQFESHKPPLYHRVEIIS